MEEIYSDDLNVCRLKDQLQQFSLEMETVEDKTIRGIISFFKAKTVAQREIYSEVVLVLTLLMLAPGTNAVSERSASCL